MGQTTLTPSSFSKFLPREAEVLTDTKSMKIERDYRKALKEIEKLWDAQTEHADGGSIGRTGHPGGGV
jgi:hypothetical protein